jgi:hypothetical protein
MPLLPLTALVRSDLTFKRAHAAAVSTFTDVVAPLHTIARNDVRYSPVSDLAVNPLRVACILQTCDFDYLQFMAGNVSKRHCSALGRDSRRIMGYLLGDILVLSLRLVKRLAGPADQKLEVCRMIEVLLGSGGRE